MWVGTEVVAGFTEFCHGRRVLLAAGGLMRTRLAEAPGAQEPAHVRANHQVPRLRAPSQPLRTRS